MRGDGGKHRLQPVAAADKDAADAGEAALTNGARNVDRLALLVLHGEQHDAAVERAGDQRLRKSRRPAGFDNQVDPAGRFAQPQTPFRCFGGGDHEVRAERTQPLSLLGARGDGRHAAAHQPGKLQGKQRDAT